MNSTGPRDIERIDDTEQTGNTSANNPPDSESPESRDSVKGAVVHEAPDASTIPKNKSKGGKHAA